MAEAPARARRNAAWWSTESLTERDTATGGRGLSPLGRTWSEVAEMLGLPDPPIRAPCWRAGHRTGLRHRSPTDPRNPTASASTCEVNTRTTRRQLRAHPGIGRRPVPAPVCRPRSVGSGPAAAILASPSAPAAEHHMASCALKPPLADRPASHLIATAETEASWASIPLLRCVSCSMNTPNRSAPNRRRDDGRTGVRRVREK